MTEMNRETSPVPAKLRGWLSQAVEAGASDLHVIVGHPPVLRLHGELIELSEPALSAGQAHGVLSALCPAEAGTRLQSQKNLDFSFELPLHGRVSRFRA